MRFVLSVIVAGVLMLSACGSTPGGSVTLSWAPPTENEDGSKLENLAGYRVYWREIQGPQDHAIQIDDPSATSFEIEGMADGKWRAGVTAFTDSAMESDLATVTFTIDRGKLEVDESTVGRIASRTEFASREQEEPAVAQTTDTELDVVE